MTICASEGGTIPAGLDCVLSGEYACGQKIEILAREMPGYCFQKWVSSNGGTFEDESSLSTKFTMPGNDVTVTALFIPAS